MASPRYHICPLISQARLIGASLADRCFAMRGVSWTHPVVPSIKAEKSMLYVAI